MGLSAGGPHSLYGFRMCTCFGHCIFDIGNMIPHPSWFVNTYVNKIYKKTLKKYIFCKNHVIDY